MSTAILSDYDRLVNELVRKGVPRDSAERTAAKECGFPRATVAAILESQIEAEGDRLMRSLGFFVVRLSQRRASKVTLGVPDRYYLHVRRQLAVWVEYKSASGKQRPEQREFQCMCAGAGVPYVLGGLEQLRAYLTAAGVATFDASGLPQPIPLED